MPQDYSVGGFPSHLDDDFHPPMGGVLLGMETKDEIKATMIHTLPYLTCQCKLTLSTQVCPSRK